MWDLVKMYQLALSGAFILILCCLGLFSNEWRTRWTYIENAWKNVGITSAFILGMLAFSSLPLGFLHNRFKGLSLIKGLGDKKLIELWVLLWTVVNCYFVLGATEGHLFVALFPILRLLDLLYIFSFAFTTNLAPKPPVRALVLLLVHYLEIIIAFAAIYLVLQSLAGGNVFALNSEAKHLTGAEAFYFSFVTGSTIGFGDIVLRIGALSSGPSVWPKIVLASLVAEVFCMLAITLLEIPRVVSHMLPPGPPTQQRT